MQRNIPPILAWLGLGALGLGALALGQDIAALRALGVPPDLPDAAVRALIVVQPALLLIAGVGVGVTLGDAVGLRAWLTARIRGDVPVPATARSLAAAAVSGVLAGTLVVGLDRALAPLTALPPVAQLPDLRTALTAIFYGGITEELMIRYGLMTLIVWLAAQVWTARPPWLYVTAIALSALLFGAGHLPAVATLAPLTPLVILRTVGLNALLGVVYGWLFWRRGLEHAMAAHIATHLTFWALAVAL